MKKPDLLVLIAVWQFLTAFGALIGIAAIVLFAIPSVTGYWDWGWSDIGWRSGVIGGIFGLSIAILMLVCMMILAIAGAIGLLSNRPRDWARIVSIVHSALSIFFIPIGTIIGTLSIIYLVRQDVREYFNPPPKQ